MEILVKGRTPNNQLLEDDAPLTDVDEVWLEEAEKRYQSYRKGMPNGIPADQLFAEIRRELGWPQRRIKP